MEDKKLSNIYESICAITADIDFIGKDKRSPGVSYKYRGVDQIYNTLHPLFAKYKVFPVPEVLGTETREWRNTKTGGEIVYQVLKVKYTFYAENGSHVEAVVFGEAMDSSDKVSNKCMSVAYKYACFQILSIPTEETAADPDDAHEELAPRNAPKRPQETREPVREQRAERTRNEAQSGEWAARTQADEERQRKTRREIVETRLRRLGATDNTLAWAEKQYGVPLEQLTDEEVSQIVERLVRAQDARGAV